MPSAALKPSLLSISWCNNTQIRATTGMAQARARNKVTWRSRCVSGHSSVCSSQFRPPVLLIQVRGRDTSAGIDSTAPGVRLACTCTSGLYTDLSRGCFPCLPEDSGACTSSLGPRPADALGPHNCGIRRCRSSTRAQLHSVAGALWPTAARARARTSSCTPVLKLHAKERCICECEAPQSQRGTGGIGGSSVPRTGTVQTPSQQLKMSHCLQPRQ